MLNAAPRWQAAAVFRQYFKHFRVWMLYSHFVRLYTYTHTLAQTMTIETPLRVDAFKLKHTHTHIATGSSSGALVSQTNKQNRSKGPGHQALGYAIAHTQTTRIQGS